MTEQLVLSARLVHAEEGKKWVKQDDSFQIRANGADAQPSRHAVCLQRGVYTTNSFTIRNYIWVKYCSVKLGIIFDPNILLHREKKFDPDKIPNCSTNWMRRHRFTCKASHKTEVNPPTSQPELELESESGMLTNCENCLKMLKQESRVFATIATSMVRKRKKLRMQFGME